MKKYTFYSLILSLVIFASSCTKDDIAPRIYFDGEVETSQDWVLQEYYTLPNASASDNVDGDISDNITVSHDLTFYLDRNDSLDEDGNLASYTLSNKLKNGMEGYIGRTGDYTITYAVSDAAGNPGSKSINVSITNSMLKWTETASGTNIEYTTKRVKTSSDPGFIGGVYKYTGAVMDYYHPEYGFDENIDSKLRADRKYNYRVSITKLANITGLKVYFDFNRFNDQIDIPMQWVEADENIGASTPDKTHFLYSVVKNGECSYGIFQFKVEYQITRYKEQAAGEIEHPSGSGIFWTYDRKGTYQELFIKK